MFSRKPGERPFDLARNSNRQRARCAGVGKLAATGVSITYGGRDASQRFSKDADNFNGAVIEALNREQSMGLW